MPAKKKTKKSTRTAAKKRGSRKKSKNQGPGRRLTDAEQERRFEALRKHGTKTSPEPLTGQQIADKLGINLGTWNVWKSNQNKGVRRRSIGRRGRPPKSASSLDGVIAGFREIERERDQLRKVIGNVQRALTAMP